MEQLKAAKEKLMATVNEQLCHIDAVDAKELGEVVDMVKDFEEAMYYCAKVKELKEKEECYKKQKEQLEVMKHIEPIMEQQKMDMMKLKEMYEGQGKRYYMDPIYPLYPEIYDGNRMYYGNVEAQEMQRIRDMDRGQGRMYYTNSGDRSGNATSNSGGKQGGRYGFHEMFNPNEYYGPHEEWQPGMYPREMLRDGREGRSPLSRKHFMESKEEKKDATSQNKELEKYLNELAEDISEMISDATPEQKIMMSQKLTSLGNKIK